MKEQDKGMSGGRGNKEGRVVDEGKVKGWVGRRADYVGPLQGFFGFYSQWAFKD